MLPRVRARILVVQADSACANQIARSLSGYDVAVTDGAVAARHAVGLDCFDIIVAAIDLDADGASLERYAASRGLGCRFVYHTDDPECALAWRTAAITRAPVVVAPLDRGRLRVAVDVLVHALFER